MKPTASSGLSREALAREAGVRRVCAVWGRSSGPPLPGGQGSGDGPQGTQERAPAAANRTPDPGVWVPSVLAPA